MKHYLIREPKTEEIYEALIVLYRSFGRLIPTDVDDQANLLNTLIKSKIAKFLIAEKEKKIFGLGGIFFFQDVCSIGYMGVLPEIRRNGVGSEIFRQLINIGKAVGCKTFLLYASKLGEPIYHKFGFRSNYYTTVYDLPYNLIEKHTINANVKITKKFPDWATNIDNAAMGFDRRDFLNIKLKNGSKLIIADREGYALISGLRLGPIIAKNIHAAVDLIKMGALLGANHIILAKHSKFSHDLFDLINLIERGDEANLKMIYGKNISQKLEYFYALGTFAKG